MRAWVGFECEGCGLLLDPSFEIVRQGCAAGCERDVWTCLSCSCRRVPCGACWPAWRARQEVEREAGRQAKREVERKRFASRPMDPML